MTPRQKLNLFEDFLAWGGGNMPDECSAEMLESYVKHSRPFAVEPDTVRAVLEDLPATLNEMDSAWSPGYTAPCWVCGQTTTLQYASEGPTSIEVRPFCPKCAVESYKHNPETPGECQDLNDRCENAPFSLADETGTCECCETKTDLLYDNGMAASYCCLTCARIMIENGESRLASEAQ